MGARPNLQLLQNEDRLVWMMEGLMKEDGTPSLGLTDNRFIIALSKFQDGSFYFSRGTHVVGLRLWLGVCKGHPLEFA